MPDDNGNTIDYRAVLADMEAKRSALDAAIASFRAAMPALSGSGLGNAAGETMADASPMITRRGVQEVPAGAFFKKSIIEATKLYLALVNKKQTTREIVEALKQGGMESTSKNFEGMVGIVLYRASKKAESGIIKLTDAWGLSEWYPPGFRPVKDDPAKSKKSKKRKIKAKKGKGAISQMASQSEQSSAKVKEMPKAV